MQPAAGRFVWKAGCEHTSRGVFIMSKPAFTETRRARIVRRLLPTLRERGTEGDMAELGLRA
jgi:hypothetical protein